MSATALLIFMGWRATESVSHPISELVELPLIMSPACHPYDAIIRPNLSGGLLRARSS